MSGPWAAAVGLLIISSVLLLIRPAPAGSGPDGSVGTGSLRRGLHQRPGSSWLRRRGVHQLQLGKEAASLLRQFVALLQSGRGEAQAWAELHRHWSHSAAEHPFSDITQQVSGSLQAGVGSAEGLRRCAEQATDPEIRGLLQRLMTAATLSSQTGAPLSKLVEQMAQSLEEAAQLRAAVETATAGPKLTQLILTLLPAGGILLGHLMGADPLQILLGGGLGMLCLVIGAVCLLLGRLWSHRLISSVLQEMP